jgi:hypothetical protein
MHGYRMESASRTSIAVKVRIVRQFVLDDPAPLYNWSKQM